MRPFLFFNKMYNLYEENMNPRKSYDNFKMCTEIIELKNKNGKNINFIIRLRHINIYKYTNKLVKKLDTFNSCFRSR